MEWTFGIITGGNQEQNINKIIDSIENQFIESYRYEVLIVGNCNICRKNTKIIDFNESIKPMWITRKKNIISEQSKFNNIAFLHDYVCLENQWYYNYVVFGEDWDVCMNPIKNTNNTRFRDWVLWGPKNIPYNNETWTKTITPILSKSKIELSDWNNYGPKLISYTDETRTNHMYVSGSYFCAKKDFMLKYPFDEKLSWGEGEDVYWSLSIRNFWNYKCNINSEVKFLKYKPDVSAKE